ncbi:MAG TPA: DUF1553 domain-containing protein [Bryobacteraceae bacterium]|nr:DUF1553 domain-containing protein [Bryobacteraceae bacterium]
MRLSRALCAVLALAIFAWAQEDSVPSEQSTAPEQGCTFRSDPAQFLNAQGRTRDAVHARVRKFAEAHFSTVEAGADAAPIRRNFIDDEIFGKLDAMNVKPAKISSDEEFLRRVYLDIIGRIPSANDVKEFVASAATDKRSRVIETLITAPEFNDKWGVWFQDLVGMTEIPSTNNRRPQIEGRNAFDGWIREQLSHNRPMTAIVYDTLTRGGNNFFTENAPANFIVLGSAGMGPAQDTYDQMLVKSATSYLGLGHYDCLLCHSGRNHLEQLTVWGTKGTRSDAQRMAAHFSRVRLNNVVPGTGQYGHALYNSTDVVDAAAGTYDLNTTFGNRPGRTPIGSERNLTPEYRDGTRATGNWRAAFANKLINDPLFGINFANRLWKEFFGIGLVDPVDTLDPDRLDANKPPASPWTLQATHPQLLIKLSQFFVENDTNLRELIKTIVHSSAYQLSSRYEPEWKVEYVPLFARHYPRRMMAEEVHDAIVKATGVMPQLSYQLVNNQTIPQITPANSRPKSDPVAWAMKMPDATEPRFLNGTQNGSVVNFLNTFLRGNRDTARRAETGSILQQLSLMNDNTVVLPKIKIANSPYLKELAKITDNGELVDDLWLTFLSRKPTTAERSKAVAHFTKVARNTAIEDLAWVAVNKVDFLFSY